MKKSTFQFLSADKKTQIYGVKWEPDQGEILVPLHIFHHTVANL